MDLREAARAASREIYANKFRSALSFAAVSVGVASLLYTLAMTRGMQETLDRNLTLMGPGRINIVPKDNYKSKGLSPGLTLDDAEALQREMPDLYMVMPESESWGIRSWVGRDDVGNLHVSGVTPDFRKRDWVYELRGRFLNWNDVRERSRVALMVLPPGWIHPPFWASFWNRGAKYKNYSERHEWLGRQIRIHETVFTVVGVMTPPPRDRDPRWDDWDTPECVVPITAFMDHLNMGERQPGQIGEIKLDTGDEKTFPERERQIKALLLRRHRGEDDLDYRVLREEIAGEMDEQKGNVVAGYALGVIALLAGGVGIMNVMLATIFARVKEIGIRRAVGAETADILAQFLLEAALLGLAGGVAGVALGLAGVRWLTQVLEGRDIAQTTPMHCALMIVLAAAVSAAFAAVPAWRASRLDPIEALRAES